MENKEYLIYGAGGHARVLKSLINAIDRSSRVLNFFSDAESPKLLDKLPVLPYDKSIHGEGFIILGIGNGKVRKSLARKVEHSFATLIHPTAFVADDCKG